MLNIRDELLETCRHQRKNPLALLFEKKKKKPPDTTIKQQGGPKHFSLKILQKPSNLIQIQFRFNSNSISIPNYNSNSPAFFQKVPKDSKSKQTKKQPQFKTPEEPVRVKQIVMPYF